MKKSILSATFVLSSVISFSQNVNSVPQAYYDNIRKADSLISLNEFRNAAKAYSDAFKADGWKGSLEDRYNSACSWALANCPDSAFYQLDKIVTKGKYTGYCDLIIDPDFVSLHFDKRWKAIIDKAKANKDIIEKNLNRKLISKLDSIYIDDQKYRVLIEGVIKRYGSDSKEIDDLGKIIMHLDSINLVKIKKIIDRYGWIGPEAIGEDGSSTLFLIIQHSDQSTQERYLPIMRKAVKDKKASASHLALLEDRVALGQGKKQIYGSQIGFENGVNYVLPLEDPDNVDKRRAEVGLPPISEYLMSFDIIWDVNQYKKKFPETKENNEEIDINTYSHNNFYLYGGIGVILIIIIVVLVIRKKTK